MSTEANNPIFAHMAETRDQLQTLLERGKPVSKDDLQALIALIEAKSNPTLTFPADEAAQLLAAKLPPLLPKPTIPAFPATEVAQLLVPKLLPLMPTPVELTKAGEQAGTSIKAAIAAGSQSSVQQVVDSMRESSRQFNKAVQESSQQLTAAAATLNKAAESVPRSVPVDFLQGWRWPTGLAVVPALVLLLALLIAGAFSGVSQVKYDSQRAIAQALADERNFYRTEIDAFSKDMQRDPESRELVETYFSKYVPLPPVEMK